MTLYLQTLLAEMQAGGANQAHFQLGMVPLLGVDDRCWLATSVPAWSESASEHVISSLSDQVYDELVMIGAASDIIVLDETAACALGILALRVGAEIILGAELYLGPVPSPREWAAAEALADDHHIPGGSRACLLMWMREHLRQD
jgi:hypothetical protein